MNPAPNTHACELCQREGVRLTRHHLIPKSTHRTKRIRKKFDRDERTGAILMLCKPCHKQIHATVTEKQLADQFNTREALLAHPDIAKFLDWISDKPPGFIPRTDKVKR